MDEDCSEPDINQDSDNDSAYGNCTCSSGDDGASPEKKNPRPKRKEFTVDEDYAIINYILDNKRYTQTGGNYVWKKAEKKNICPGRSFWAMKERFRRRIVRDLKKYFLDEEIQRKLRREDVRDGEQEDEEGVQELYPKKYTKEEDKALMDFYASSDKKLNANGIKLWKLAQAQNVCPGRTFWSMRERFNKFIQPNMESYEEDGKSKFKIRKSNGVPNGQGEGRQKYNIDEDMSIIKYVTEGDRYLQVNGLKIWKEAQEEDLCPGRSFQSMKERFKKVIIPNIDIYQLTGQMEEKLNFIKNASSEEIASMRSSNKLKNNPVKTENGAARRSSRFQYPSILEQKSDESPMGQVKVISEDVLTKTPAPKKSKPKREQSPQPCCSKDLSPVRTKNSGKMKKKTSPKNTSPKNASPKNASPAKILSRTEAANEALRQKIEKMLETSSDDEESIITSKYFATVKSEKDSESEPEMPFEPTVTINNPNGPKRRKRCPFFDQMREDSNVKKNNDEYLLAREKKQSPSTDKSRNQKRPKKIEEKNLELLKVDHIIKKLKKSNF